MFVSVMPSYSLTNDLIKCIASTCLGVSCMAGGIKNSVVLLIFIRLIG